MPRNDLNIFVKWLWSQNPVSDAISDMHKLVCSSSRDAALIRVVVM